MSELNTLSSFKQELRNTLQQSNTFLKREPFLPALHNNEKKQVFGKKFFDDHGDQEPYKAQASLHLLKQKKERRNWTPDVLPPDLPDYMTKEVGLTYNWFDQDNYLQRAKDKDTDLRPLFQDPNYNYRKKFEPQVNPKDFLSDQEKHLTYELQMINTNLSRTSQRLKNFNNKYQGQYSILQAKNFQQEHPNTNYQQDIQRDIELKQKLDEIEGQRKAHLEKLKQGNQMNLSRGPKVRFSDQHLGSQIKQSKLANKSNNGSLLPQLNHSKIHQEDFTQAKQQQIDEEESVEVDYYKQKDYNQNNSGIFSQDEQFLRKSNNFNTKKSVRILNQKKQRVGLTRPRDESPNKDPTGLTAQCPEGCGRWFKHEILQKHIGICKKVFQGKRKPFNSSQQRNVRNNKPILNI